MDQIMMFVTERVNIKPFPNINIIPDHNDADDFLISTGYYDPETQTVNLFIDGRHIKDVLRSFTHELMHHAQFLKSRDYFLEGDKSGSLCDNDFLRRLEGDAYLNGNLLFRMWTESVGKDK